jgi:predicted 3-demethylubiquinone-9 3-methyltransferase (glyoxalase superfamily)
MPRITPSLWFDSDGEEATEFYVSILPKSQVRHVSRYGEGGMRAAGTAMTVDFVLDGQPYTAINGGPAHACFTEAISFRISCADQDEVDYHWTRLVEGGSEGPCGWLKDRYACPGRSFRPRWASRSATPTLAGRAAPRKRCSR